MNHFVFAVMAMSAMIGTIDGYTYNSQTDAGLREEYEAELKKADQNSNGFLEKEEFGEDEEESGFPYILELYGGKDGKLSITELAIYSVEDRREMEALFTEKDQNSNGFVEKEEFGQWLELTFSSLLALGDSNKDGKLSIPEVAIYFVSKSSGANKIAHDKTDQIKANQDKATEAIKGLDTNNDGFISKDEMATILGWVGCWMRGDKNGDGKISLTELNCADPSVAC